MLKVNLTAPCQILVPGQPVSCQEKPSDCIHAWNAPTITHGSWIPLAITFLSNRNPLSVSHIIIHFVNFFFDISCPTKYFLYFMTIKECSKNYTLSLFLLIFHSDELVIKVFIIQIGLPGLRVIRWHNFAHDFRM